MNEWEINTHKTQRKKHTTQNKGKREAHKGKRATHTRTLTANVFFSAAMVVITIVVYGKVFADVVVMGGDEQGATSLERLLVRNEGGRAGRVPTPCSDPLSTYDLLRLFSDRGWGYPFPFVVVLTLIHRRVGGVGVVDCRPLMTSSDFFRSRTSSRRTKFMCSGLEAFPE